MVPDGEVIDRIDKYGNRMASAGRLARLCVLVGTNSNPKYVTGTRVHWKVTKPGNWVDFSRDYHRLDEESGRTTGSQDTRREDGQLPWVVFSTSDGSYLVLTSLAETNRFGQWAVIARGPLFGREAILVNGRFSDAEELSSFLQVPRERVVGCRITTSQLEMAIYRPRGYYAGLVRRTIQNSRR